MFKEIPLVGGKNGKWLDVKETKLKWAKWAGRQK